MRRRFADPVHFGQERPAEYLARDSWVDTPREGSVRDPRALVDAAQHDLFLHRSYASTRGEWDQLQQKLQQLQQENVKLEALEGMLQPLKPETLQQK